MKKELVEKYFDKDYPINTNEEFLGSLFDVYKKAFNTALKVGFSNGYACAAANLVKGHGENTLAEELMRCNPDFEDIDEYDLEILEPIITELKRKREL